ncbi:hypothetical protein [uncultured Draconibacterium sp.]|uniref:hypothetical protein n=1 Tax=uncultured Draconibacterium sp. TaxID=1573823 RepID=UPI002AA6E422|nr:hypothetical protein [uncultured Draconibacterium sp.]
MNRFILVVIIIGFYSQSVFSQDRDSINNYDDVCFCNVRLAHPEGILRLDNNKEILFALKNEKTLHQLDKLGIAHSESQIKLLQLSGLIEKKDSLYQTIIPIFSEYDTKQLRDKTKKIAENIIPLFQNDYENFLSILNSKGLAKNSYSIFFAFVLDGLVWDILENNGDISDMNITKEKPFWNGVFWMLKPKRDFSCGTNSLSSDNFSINVNWSDNSQIKISSYKLLREFLNDYDKNEKITQIKYFEEFRKNNFFNEKGEIQIPVIIKDGSDIIYIESKKIANTVVEYLSKEIDYTSFLTEYPNLSKGQKIIILYHEIMWDILDIMENNKLLKKPIAFGEPMKAKDKDLKDLVFIVKK